MKNDGVIRVLRFPVSTHKYFYSLYKSNLLLSISFPKILSTESHSIHIFQLPKKDTYEHHMGERERERDFNEAKISKMNM